MCGNLTTKYKDCPCSYYCKFTCDLDCGFRHITDINLLPTGLHIEPGKCAECRDLMTLPERPKDDDEKKRDDDEKGGRGRGKRPPRGQVNLQ